MARGRKNSASRPRPRLALGPTGSFVLRFALVWLGALGLFALVPQIERWMVEATIATVRWSGSLVGIPSQVRGEVVLFRGAQPALIASDCTTLLPMTLLWSGIVAYPAAARWKLLGMAAGAAILWGYNLLRIVMMIAILGWDPWFVRFFHVFVWQTVTIVFACALFVLWLRKSPSHALGT